MFITIWQKTHLYWQHTYFEEFCLQWLSLSKMLKKKNYNILALKKWTLFNYMTVCIFIDQLIGSQNPWDNKVFFLLEIVKTNYETIRTAILTLTTLSYLSNQYVECSWCFVFSLVQMWLSVKMVIVVRSRGKKPQI